jgi:putative ABC transport system ATP-binding protein
MGMSALLAARELGRFAPDVNRWLLDGVSIEVRSGERLVIVGPSGSGKTLLLRALANLDPWDRGTLVWNGAALTRKEMPLFRSQIIYLHQRPALQEGMVLENLQFPFSLTVHRSRQFAAQRVRDWLASLNRSDEFLTKQSRDLSGGEAQLVALLRAIQLDPVVLLLDEPTAALDPEMAEAVESCVVRWHREDLARRAVVWVSHNREQAERMADRRVVLNAGRIVEEN